MKRMIVLGLVLLLGLALPAYAATVNGTNNLILQESQDGKVGIGTTEPNEKLDVNGNVNATAYKVGGTAGASGSFSVIPDSYTKLLLHMEGTGNSFIDSSTTSKTITANGDVTQTTAQYKFGSKSAVFDGNGDYLSLADSDDWNFGTGDFTIDFWLRSPDIVPAAHQDILQHTGTGSGVDAIQLTLRDDGKLQCAVFDEATNIINLSVTHSMDDNTWYHIALVRNNNTFTFYVNGVSIGNITDADAIPDYENELKIGSGHAGHADFDGWLDEFCISKGIARWTANFTPPTAAYGTVTVTNGIITGL